jgi:hypothetical protein
MSVSIIKAWKTALEVKSFRLKSIISATLLILCALSAPYFFQLIQERDGYILHDYLLAVLPSIDLSYWIFILLYIFILYGVTSLLYTPNQFLIAVQAYILLTIFRFITIFLVPLDPPAGIIELNDPFVQYFLYQQSITKDLFFSGHTSLLLLLAFSMPSARARYILFAGSILVATMLLIQHAHYTIDILAAPVFTWLVWALAKKLP